MAPWFRLAFDTSLSDADAEALGSRNKSAAIGNPLEPLLALGHTATTSNPTSNNATLSPALTDLADNTIAGIISAAANQTGWHGILGKLDPMLFFNISVNETTYVDFLNQSNQTLEIVQTGFTLANLSATGFNLTEIQPLPWFVNTNLVADDDLDDLISSDILTTLYVLSAINSSTLRLGTWYGALHRYPEIAQSIQTVSNMPWGILRFSAVNTDGYEYMIQAGTDERFLNVASYPPEGLRKMAFQTMFSRAICTPPLQA